MDIKITQRFNDKEQEKFLAQHKEELIEYAVTRGEQHGIDNKPASVAEFRALIFNNIETNVQAAIDDNQRRHLLLSGMIRARQIRQVAQEKTAALRAKLNDLTNTIRLLLNEKKQLTPDLERMQRRKWTYWGAWFVAAGEGYFAFEALRYATMPPLPAIFTSICIAIIIGFGIDVAAGWIKKAKNRIQRIIRYSIVYIPAITGFYALGYLRAEGYNAVFNLKKGVGNINIPTTGHVSDWNITILSFLLFVAALAFSIKYHKTDKERELEQKYNLKCNEIAEVEAERQAILQEIRDIEAQADAQEKEALERFEYALSNENRLQTLAKEVLEKYKDKNMRFRPDKACPDFFSNPPEFNFRLFFDVIKQHRA